VSWGVYHSCSQLSGTDFTHNMRKRHYTATSQTASQKANLLMSLTKTNTFHSLLLSPLLHLLLLRHFFLTFCFRLLSTITLHISRPCINVPVINDMYMSKQRIGACIRQVYRLFILHSYVLCIDI
jgi:hypothetical protein